MSSPRRREQAGRVEAAGLVEGALRGAQQVGQGEDRPSAGRPVRPGAGRSAGRPRRSRPCRRSRTTRSRRNGARRPSSRRTAATGGPRSCRRAGSATPRVAAARAAGPPGRRAGPRSAGSRPRARPRCPGVRIVTATATGSWRGPAARISSGASPTTRSSRTSSDSPRTATIRWLVTCRTGGPGVAGQPGHVVASRVCPKPSRASAAAWPASSAWPRAPSPAMPPPVVRPVDGAIGGRAVGVEHRAGRAWAAA